MTISLSAFVVVDFLAVLFTSSVNAEVAVVEMAELDDDGSDIV